MEKLWDENTLNAYCKHTDKRSISQAIRENIASYGLKEEGLPGILSALLGNIPDESLRRLLSGDIRGLLNMTMGELTQLPGISKDKALRLLAAFELAKKIATAAPCKRPSIKNPEDAVRLVMGEMRQLDREQFWALLLNVKNQVIAREVISIGTLNSSTVHPRELFKNAVRQSAAAMVVVHNHPSGDPEPSKEDIDITKKLVEAGRLLGIEILDHLIIGDGQFVSFKAKGLI